MSEARYILDTSALIELYTQTEKGGKVIALIKNAKILVPAVVVAELKSKLERLGIESETCLKGIKESSQILDLTFEIAEKAGKKHALLRKEHGNISLADCIVMIHSEIEGITVITCDSHFKGSSAVVL